MAKSKQENVIEIWKTVVGVQQHFNDIAMKIRGLFVTLVVAIAAAQGFLIEKHLSFPLGPITVLYAIFLPLLGIVAAYLFYFMDRYWYHRLLLGAVTQAGEIENKYSRALPELALGSKISAASPIVLHNYLARRVADVVVTDDRYKKTGKLHSDAKIELFYKSIVLLFWVWFAFSVLFVGVFVANQSVIEYVAARIKSLLF